MNQKEMCKVLTHDVLIPLHQLLATEEISQHYNYLPDRREDDDDLAWAFYYEHIQNIRKNLKRIKGLEKKAKRELENLIEEIESFTMCCPGIDYLPQNWMAANPRLYFFTSAAGIFHDLYKNGEIELLHKFKYTSRDLKIDRIRTMHLKRKGVYAEILELVDTFWILVTGIFWENPKLLQMIIEFASQDDELISPIQTTENLVKKAKKRKQVCMNDESAREKEGELRSSLLRDILGDFETISPQGELKKYVEKFEKEQHCNVYQIVTQGKNVILLYVSYEQPFWKMIRPKNGPIGVYVQGCVMNKKTGEIEKWKLVPVVVKRHKLSIEKSIVGLDN